MKISLNTTRINEAKCHRIEEGVSIWRDGDSQKSVSRLLPFYDDKLKEQFKFLKNTPYAKILENLDNTLYSEPGLCPIVIMILVLSAPAYISIFTCFLCRNVFVRAFWNKWQAISVTIVAFHQNEVKVNICGLKQIHKEDQI